MRDLSDVSPMAERVLDAAEGLVQQHGYNGFSYDDVARLVGIKKPSIHHHFATKAELVAVVARRYSSRFGEQLVQIESKHAKAPARLVAYAALFERTFAQDRRLCVCGMLGAEAQSLPEEVAQEVGSFFRANLAWLTQIFAEGQRSASIQPGRNASALAELYLCALEGAMVVGRGMPSTRGPTQVARTLLSQLVAER
jgi:TetR/AcrR family transcriptional regulator, transcriptional repressor for nem operon